MLDYKKLGGLLAASLLVAIFAVTLVFAPIGHSQNNNAPVATFWNSQTGLYSFLLGGSNPGFVTVANSFTDPYVTTNFSCSTGCTSLAAITGLTWSLPANVATNSSFICHLAYSQATAAAADAFGIADSVAPTNIFATGTMKTTASAGTTGILATLTTTTATNIVSATPGATATNYEVSLDGFIQQPSNNTAPVISIEVLTGSSSDAITVLQGSYCQDMK